MGRERVIGSSLKRDEMMCKLELYVLLVDV